MAAVAEHAGIAKGTVYLYFDSKEALFGALRMRFMERLDQASGANRPAGGVRERVAYGVAASQNYLIAHAQLYDILFRSTGGDVRALENGRAVLRGFVASMQNDGVDFVDPDAAAAFLLYGLQGMLNEAVRGKVDDLERWQQAAVQLTYRVLDVQTGAPGPG